MRFLPLVLLLAGFFVAACQTTPSNNVGAHSATQPAGPMDNVTNPLNQPSFTDHNTMR